MARRKRIELVDAEYLRSVLHYDPETGIFTWLKQTSSRAVIGAQAGCIDRRGSRVIGLRGETYFDHRLAWLYMTGEWPDFEEIDHEDGEPSNCRWVNLRPCTRLQNMQNTRRGRGSSQYLGVSRTTTGARDKPWIARIMVFGVEKWLGQYATEEDASAAYLAAKRELHPFASPTIFAGHAAST